MFKLGKNAARITRTVNAASDPTEIVKWVIHGTGQWAGHSIHTEEAFDVVKATRIAPDGTTTELDGLLADLIHSGMEAKYEESMLRDAANAPCPADGCRGVCPACA